MPDAPLRPCANVPCRNRVKRGRCADCVKKAETRRGNRHQRGYTNAWDTFRSRFVSELADAGIVAMCGASLPSGPVPRDSQCRAAGLIVGDDLQLHHDPPLRPDERDKPWIVQDSKRVMFLCRQCHTKVTFEGR